MLGATLKAVEDRDLTTLITHNMEQAIALGDWQAMMHDGRVTLDQDRTEEASLGAADLVARCHDAVSDHLLLARGAGMTEFLNKCFNLLPVNL